MAKLFVEAGVIALTAFISPFRSDRDRIRALVQPDEFIEIYCSAPIEICEQRDVKGLYAKARTGEIPNFTGISSPYEPPHKPELVIDTGNQALEDCVETVINYLSEKRYLAYP